MPDRLPFPLPLLVLIALTTALLSGCASHRPLPAAGLQPSLSGTTFTSFDGDRFPYRKWVPAGRTDLVVIGIHGIAGAADDLRNLAEHLQEELPGAAVYAPDLRGQGNDPIEERRGDIRNPTEWFDDLRTFSTLARRNHPGARVVWCGESMGSLIALHAVTERAGPPPCDALILSSPVARIGDRLPGWRRLLLRWAAFLFPSLKLSLESLSGEDEVRVIRDVVHQEQAATNAYHVSEFSLRLLNTLGNMIESMPRQARRAHLPVLILHGGNDIFSDPADVSAFAEQFPSPPGARRLYYPESYHLLFYDHQRDEVLADIAAWLRTL